MTSTPEAETVEPRWFARRSHTLPDMHELVRRAGHGTWDYCVCRSADERMLNRIAAALNSVEGISTEELEAMQPGVLAKLRTDAIEKGIANGIADVQSKFERQLHAIFERLKEYYDFGEANLWLDTEHPLLEGQIPRHVIFSGRASEVEAILDSLETGAFI